MAQMWSVIAHGEPNSKAQTSNIFAYWLYSKLGWLSQPCIRLMKIRKEPKEIILVSSSAESYTQSSISDDGIGGWMHLLS